MSSIESAIFHPKRSSDYPHLKSDPKLQYSITVATAYATMSSRKHVSAARGEVTRPMDESKKTTYTFSPGAPGILGLSASGAGVVYAGVGLVTNTLEKHWASMLLIVALITGCAFLVASLHADETRERANGK